MKKTLYSLVLNDEVVREVDALAHRMGTNRSNLINQILAEYVNYTTPEQRINEVFSTIEQLMAPSRELVPFFSPNSYSMSLKSSLEYKYRPTVKYEVELYRGAAYIPLGRSAVGYYFLQMLQLTAIISIGLGIFNLLPLPPLDGSKVLFSLMSDESYYKLMRYERYGGILMLILVATGVLGKPLSAAIDAVYAWLVPLAQLACDGVFYLFFK